MQEGYQNRAILDLSKAISHKHHKINVWFLLRTNRKSYALYQTVLFPVTLGDPNYPKSPLLIFCVPFHTFIVGGDRDFKFGR